MNYRFYSSQISTIEVSADILCACLSAIYILYLRLRHAWDISRTSTVITPNRPLTSFSHKVKHLKSFKRSRLKTAVTFTNHNDP